MTKYFGKIKSLFFKKWSKRASANRGENRTTNKGRRAMQKKEGFTLIELLVVIAIIGILAGLVIPKMDRSMANAREQTCRNNLKQLQSAVLDYAMDNGGSLPYALSWEYREIPSGIIRERRGWVSWWLKSGKAEGPDQAKSMVSELFNTKTDNISQLGDDRGCGRNAEMALWAGTIWDYTRDVNFYSCPVIRRASGQNQIFRTYAMNEFFGAPTFQRGLPCKITHIGVTESFAGHKVEASKLMLFSEIVPIGTDLTGRSGMTDKCQEGDHSADCGFCPKAFDDTRNEMIGHDRSGNRFLGHSSGEKGLNACLAIFFDGHIEKVFPGIADKDPDTGVLTGAKTPNAAKVNTVWFLNRSFAPDMTDPTVKK